MICDIFVTVSFQKHTITKKDYGVVEGDYNTTRLVFNFEEDVSDQRIMFKMSNPNNELVLMQELDEKNQIVLAGFDEEGNVYSIFNTSGPHPFELVLYGEDSKLTSATGWLTVNKRQVNISDGVVEGVYLPVMDDILREIKTFQDMIDTHLGMSAYEIAVKNGFEGTEREWLESLGGIETVGLVELSPIVEDIISGEYYHKGIVALMPFPKSVESYPDAVPDYAWGLLKVIKDGGINTYNIRYIWGETIDGVLFQGISLQDTTTEEIAYIPCGVEELANLYAHFDLKEEDHITILSTEAAVTGYALFEGVANLSTLSRLFKNKFSKDTPGGSSLKTAEVVDIEQGANARYVILKKDDMDNYPDLVLNATISGMFDGPYGSFENENVTIRLTNFYEPEDCPGYVEGIFDVASETNSLLNNVAYGNTILYKLGSIFDIVTRINQSNKSELEQEWLETIDAMFYVITEVSALSFADSSSSHKSVTEGLITTEFLANYL